MVRFRVAFVSMVTSIVVVQLLTTTKLHAQQVVVGTPMTSVTDDFYENFNFGFGFVPGGSLGGIRSGSFGAPPPFGGFNPGAGGSIGFRNGPFGFNLAAGHGSTRGFTSVTPMVTIPNGGTGGVFDTRQRPFVTGVVPVVGGQNRAYLFDLVDRMRAEGKQVAPTSSSQAKPASAADVKLVGEPKIQSGSSAERGDISLAAIRAQRDAEDAAESQEVLVWIERGRLDEEAGRRGSAKICYKNAAKRATGDLRKQLIAKVRALSAKPADE